MCFSRSASVKWCKRFSRCFSWRASMAASLISGHSLFRIQKKTWCKNIGQMTKWLAIVAEFRVLHPIEKKTSRNILNVWIFCEQTITGPILLHCSSDMTMCMYSSIDENCYSNEMFLLCVLLSFFSNSVRVRVHFMIKLASLLTAVTKTNKNKCSLFLLFLLN